MKKWTLISMTFLLGLLLIACAHQANTSTRQTQTAAVHKSRPAQLPYTHVIAGTKTIAEYTAALDIPLVGVSTQDNQPALYNQATRIGLPRALNMEVVGRLKPDLFIGDAEMKALSDTALAQQKIKRLYLDNTSSAEVLKSIQILGKTFHRKQQVQALTTKIKAQTKQALKGTAKLKGRKVLILFGAGHGFMVVTQHAYLGDLLTQLGVTNVAGNITSVPSPYVPYSLETAVAANPDVILTLAHGRPEAAKAAFKEELAKPQWQATDAVKNQRVYPLDDTTYPVTGNLHTAQTIAHLKKLLLRAD